MMHMLIIQLIKLLQCEIDKMIQRDTQRGTMQSEIRIDNNVVFKCISDFILNLCTLVSPKMSTFAKHEHPDDNAAFHQGLHNLSRQTRPL